MGKNYTVKSLGTGGEFYSGLEDAESVLSVLKQKMFHKITTFWNKKENPSFYYTAHEEHSQSSLKTKIVVGFLFPQYC